MVELSRARSARSGAPWVTKFGKLSIRENLVMTQRTRARPLDISHQHKTAKKIAHFKEFLSWTCADHYQKTNNMGSGSLRYTIWHSPIQAGRICLTHTRSLLIRIFTILMKAIQPRKFGNHLTVYRPPDLPSVRTTGIPMFNLTLSSQYGSLQPDIVHLCFD